MPVFAIQFSKQKVIMGAMQVQCRATPPQVAEETSNLQPNMEPASQPPESEFPDHVAAASGTAAATVRQFYAAFNRGDFKALPDLFAEDCVYHDAVYLEPKFGRAAVTAYFQKFSEGVNVDNVFFTVTELAGDDTSCGVAWCAPYWHLCYIRVQIDTFKYFPIEKS